MTLEGFDRLVAKMALPAVLATFIGMPLGVWFYDSVHIPSQFPEGAKVFTLYWSGEKGITRERVNGINYWRSGHEKVAKLVVERGDHVMLRLISADTHHGFALPAFGITDAVIKPGDVTTVEFVADKEGRFPFFCTIRCGPMHEDLEAVLEVRPPSARRG